jgi:hypothetical protein
MIDASRVADRRAEWRLGRWLVMTTWQRSVTSNVRRGGRCVQRTPVGFIPKAGSRIPARSGTSDRACQLRRLDCLGQQGSSQVGTAEVGPSQRRMTEIGPSEVGTLELGAGKIRGPPVGIRQVGSSEINPSEVGCRQPVEPDPRPVLTAQFRS